MFCEKADRAFTRSAVHTQHLNISIRTVSGERRPFHHNLFKNAIDMLLKIRLRSAIDMLGIVSMQTHEIVQQIVQQIVQHIRSAPRLRHWCVGARLRPRMHPWDEAELPLPTFHWIDLQADSPREAHAVIQRLLELAIANPHHEQASPKADHVFAYALNQN